MDTTFLDATMQTLARGGPGMHDAPEVWAKRIAVRALALATARERLLLEVEAGDDCPKCEGERRKADERDRELQALQAGSRALALDLSEIAKAVGETGDFVEPPDVIDAARRVVAERDALKAEVERLRSAPPTVCTVDVESVAEEVCAANYPGGISSDDALAILRKHTRAADPEALAKAIDSALTLEDQAHAAIWTEEQRETAWDFHLRTRGYTIDIPATRDVVCAEIARVAPAFVPTIVLPVGPDRVTAYDSGYDDALTECRKALRSLGLRVENNPKDPTNCTPTTRIMDLQTRAPRGRKK